MNTAITRFEEAIASLMPKHEADAYRKECAQRIENAARARETVRVELALAFERMGSALHRPDVGRADLEQALIHLNRALSAAAVLDPE